MRFDIITIFPKIFDSYLKETFIKKAQEKNLIKINVYDLRKWANNKHKRVDDRPFGGKFGMVLKVEPIFKAVKAIIQKTKNKRQDARHKIRKSKIILFTPRGKKFNQQMAYKFSRLNQLIIICGRYEGVDERVAKIADIELSIGEYDLMGGELPAMVVIEAVSRLIPGVLGKEGFLKERITPTKGFIEYPQYTRPRIFELKKYIKNWKDCPAKFHKEKVWRVPNVLLSGDHKKIEEWRKKRMKSIGN